MTGAYQYEASDWNYYPLHERFREYTATAVAATFYGVALTQIFNPLALGVAATYAVAKTGYAYWSMTREGAAQKLVDQGYLSEPQQTRTQQWVDAAVEVAGMEPHKAYRVEDEFIKAVTPWYLRWALDLAPELKQSMMEKAAFAMTTHDITAISGEFLEKHPQRQEYFAVMHEMGHNKVEDSYKPMNWVKVTKKSITNALLLGTAVAMVAGVVGLGAGSPLILASGIGIWKGAAMLAGAGFVTNLFLNYSSRIMERRADRNAVFLTRDPQAGIDLMQTLHGYDEPKSHEAITGLLATHPPLGNRIANIREAANKVGAYAPPATAVDPTVAAESSKVEGENQSVPADSGWRRGLDTGLSLVHSIA